MELNGTKGTVVELFLEKIDSGTIELKQVLLDSDPIYPDSYGATDWVSSLAQIFSTSSETVVSIL